uniref:Uncharacterized protein n=1 Tax=Anopheles melas TaxID=34690 RepID=A0A182TWC6_9DIPT
MPIRTEDGQLRLRSNWMVVFGRPNLTLVEGRIVVGRVGDPQIVDTVAVVLVEGEPRIADDFITEAKRKPVLGPLDPPGQVLDLAAQHHLVPLVRLDVVRRDAEGLLWFGIGRRHISTAHCRTQNATGQRTEIIRSVMDMWTLTTIEKQQNLVTRNIIPLHVEAAENGSDRKPMPGPYPHAQCRKDYDRKG